MQVYGTLGQSLPCFPRLRSESLLVVGFPPDDLRQRMILVLPLEELELLTLGIRVVQIGEL